jgi:hypothetical protein
MQLEIRGHHFPGRSWHLDGKPCHNVHVGIQVGREPHDLVPGDADTGVWITAIEVLERGDDVDFRGPAVQGRRGERFVYLTWGNVGDDGSFTMFRRAKLMLSTLEPLVAGTDGAGQVVGTVDLTDDCGGPRCARLRSPALVLAADPPRT